MKRFRVLLGMVTLLILVLFSCKKESESIDFQYAYYPIIEGNYIDYEVLEIIHDSGASTQHDTSHYYLRTLIGDTVMDNEGRVARKFFRYKKSVLSASWQIKDVWTTILTDNRAELVEENQRVIKLVFAPTKYKEWNANAFNVNDELNCFYSGLHLPFLINNLSFDSTVTVQQDEAFNLITYINKYEVYAKNVGLVKKYYKDLTINNFDTLNVSDGTELYYNCIDYGHL